MGAGAKLAYVRVSTVEQNEGRQVEALSQYGIDRWYTEKVSGKNLDRPQLREMLAYAREGDTIYIHDWSRISRSTKDLLALVDELSERGIHLVSHHEGFDTSTPSGRLMLTVLGAINEFERMNLLERQREGIAIAKRAGKYKGRKRLEVADIAAVYRDWVTRHKSKAQLARENGISRPTLDKLLKEYEKKTIAAQKSEGAV
ncbi:recombinase family protein [Candidatus Agathobaculum pullicola]|uniref:recombinase family protein n=1 Tax=Candidatus Agathobaculum pullicola TaxID=2838426 RepID=UPI003F8F4484